ncbi:MAG: ribonuclease P protein component [Bacteroidetes bacterium]|nr:ribonuclease P protein component [Bacteroidota bacterium]
MPEARESKGLYRSRVIRGKDRLTAIYENGSVFRSSSVLVRFLLEPNRYQPQEPVQVAFTISRRVGNAVRRNQIRRWMRESIRLRFSELQRIPVPVDNTLSIVLSYRSVTGTSPGWKEIQSSVESVVGRLVALGEKGFSARH